MTDRLTCWTVYERPKDWPDWFVAREFYSVRGSTEVFATDNMRLARSLEAIRKLIPPGFPVCIARSAGDDPTIVETWW